MSAHRQTKKIDTWLPNGSLEATVMAERTMIEKVINVASLTLTHDDQPWVLWQAFDDRFVIYTHRYHAGDVGAYPFPVGTDLSMIAASVEAFVAECEVWPPQPSCDGSVEQCGVHIKTTNWGDSLTFTPAWGEWHK